MIKILDTLPALMQGAREYKAATPGGIVVLRAYTTSGYVLSDDPATSARDFWNRVLGPSVNGLSASDRNLIDYMEGPNECDQTPCWGSVTDARWFNDFWVALAPIIKTNGFRPCAFSVPVGNPPGNATEVRQKIDAIVPALRVCLALGGAWSYHSYTQPYTKDVSQEIWYSLRYRQYYDYFRANYPDLVNLPILFTEAGVDNGKGWNWPANGDEAKYKDWLQWWDSEIRKDPYVLGATLFEIGQPEVWTSWDLEPIAPWLATYIASQRPNTPLIGVTPDKLDLSVSQGTNPPAIVLAISNAGSSVLNFSLSNAIPWITAQPSSGSSTGEARFITLNMSSSGFSPGTYTGSIFINATNAPDSPHPVDVVLRVLSTNEVPDAFEDFETLPAWATTFDASWGSPATWTSVAGGYSGKALQAARPNAGSSVKALVFAISPQRDYRISIAMRGPASGLNYWAECGFKLGIDTAQSFDATPTAWQMLKKFSPTGINGNNNLWTVYTADFTSFTNARATLAFKLGSTGGGAPTVQWDAARLTPIFTRIETRRTAGGVELFWNATGFQLQQSQRPTGIWSTVAPTPVPPYVLTPTNPATYFRLRK